MDQQELFDGIRSIDPVEIEPNEMRRVYGPGPDGKRCKTCVFLRRKRMGGTYLKCSLRIETNGAATDHRAGWLTCAKYEEGSER